MPVEITIITGSRKGERIQLDSDLFRVGDSWNYEVYLNPEDDPEAAGRRAVVVLEESGWRIRNTGSGLLWVNQDVVDGSTPLRSGDTVRMSDMGPDLRFKLISEHDVATAASEETPESPVESQPTEEPDDTELPDAVAAESSWAPARLGLLIGAVAIVLVAVVVMLKREPESEPIEPPPPPVAEVLKLRDIPDQSVKEGQSLSFTAEIAETPADSSNVTFSLDGQVPDGMKIDARTGRITWTPTERQGPDEYGITATAATSASQGLLSDSKTIKITVQEVNQAPWMVPISYQILDAENNDTLRLKVEASDPDSPPGRLTYFLATGSPDGVNIDERSGQLTWTPTAQQRGREHGITVCVRDDGPDARTAQTSFQVRVTAVDEWTIMTKQVGPAVCLLVAVDPKTDRAFPFGSACAIRNDTLLTSGVLATELEKLRRSGWKIQANWPEHGKTLDVSKILVHRLFLDTADAPHEQIYWDLAVLTVAGGMTDLATLADARDLSVLEQGMPLGCLAIAHNAEPLTRFDTPMVELQRVKLSGQIPLPTPDGAVQPGAPVLLCISGSPPDRIHGSPIVNQAGKVVGVYAEKAQYPEGHASQSRDHHYASQTTPVRAWLAGQGIEHWKTPEWQTNN